MFTIGGTSNRGFYPYEPTGSLRFPENTGGGYLSKTFGSNGTDWTFSTWVKRSGMDAQQVLLASSSTGNPFYQSILTFNSSNQLEYYQFNNGGSKTSQAVSTAVFRDTSSFYHVVCSYDEGGNTTLYVNGEQVAQSANGSTDRYINKTTYPHYIGNYTYQSNPNGNFHGYMSEIYFIDGQALDPTSFAEAKNGVWVPKDAKGSLTFGTNGFYLPFNSTVTAEGQSTVLYEGVSGTQTIQGMGYKPDLLWVKRRTGGTAEHALHDRLRGPSGIIGSDNTNAEIQRGYVTAFHDDGFALADNVSNYNTSGSEYVAWAWDAGADQTPTGFGCVTYTGSGTRRPVRDVGFTPDLVWVKNRDETDAHALFDSVRGATNRLRSDQTNAEQAQSTTLMSFDSDGFTVGSHSSVNASGEDIVAWAWDAGDGDPVSNDDGDITSTVKASDTHGFSIVSYTGTGANATIGHGLSSAPELIIAKRTDSVANWTVGHFPELGNGKYLKLNTTDSEITASNVWNSTSPTSTLVSVGTSSATNFSGGDYIAYCFHSVSGYSKFGSYTGSGSSGNAVTGLGFRPAFVMIKRTDSTGNWVIFDTTRSPHNTADNAISADSSDREYTSADGVVGIDFDSDGFTLQDGHTTRNASSGNYIYAAFAGGLDSIAPVNTDGDIDSRVKASDDTGFSIVRYEGSGTADDGVGHGLSSTPDIVFCKRLDATSAWRVQAYSTLGAEFLDLNTTAAADSAQYNQVWGATAPTSSVIHVGGSADVTQTNASGGDYVMYCWTATTGKSAFGSYTGNGSASGPSVTGLGFKPSLIIIKRTDAANNWIIQDTFRDTDGTVDNRLYPNLSNAEDTGGSYGWTADSDGFTIKTSEAGWNASGGTYLYMAFKDGKDSSFFHDESGQGNSFEPENLQNYDVVPDSPTNNFGIVSPLAGAGMTLSEGNLKVATTANYRGRYGSFGVSSGKWYYEIAATDYATGGGVMLGWGHRPEEGDDENPYDHGFGVSTYDGSVYVEGTQSTATGYTSKGANYTADGDIYGIVLDVDNETLYVHKNGTYFNSADPAAGTGGLSVSSSFTAAGGRFMLPMIARGGSYNETYTFNFGQDDSFAGTVTPGGYTDAEERGAFKYPVSSGFLSLCTANLPEPDISPANGQEPADYFNTVLYTGNNTAGTGITTGNSPDFVWIKRRDASNNHGLFDSVRGATKRLSSNRTNAEDTLSGVTSFDSNGFTLGTDLNDTGFSGVAWNWAAGGTAVSNTDGSITSSVSANTKAGFSIVNYTGNHLAGATVGHGLDSAPELVIIKNRDSAESWSVSAINNTYGLLLNDNAASSSGNSPLTGPASATTLPLVEGNHCNEDGAEHIAYCFHSVEGYSKIGSYTGNGSSSDGPFVYCGFRPAFILTKRTDGSGSSWEITDATRSSENVVNENLYADLSDSEYSFGNFDYLSNGFKLRSGLSASAHNISGANYIFIAFAESPFKYAQAR